MTVPHLRFGIFILLFGFGSSLSSAHAGLRPLCDRSHAYAVELLSPEQHATDPDWTWQIGQDPLWITPETGARLVATGDYVRVPSPDFSGREYYYPFMQMGIGNALGRWGTGLCWWHSRFHRAAIYLMDFAPARPKPDSKTARALLDKIAHFQPATIPGYRSLVEFTTDFSDELKSVLSDWELRTTVLAPGHAVGGWMTKTLVWPKSRKKLYNESAWNIVDDVETVPRPVFVQIETKDGIHGILALGARVDPQDKTRILLRVVDSNSSGGSYEKIFIENGEYSPASEEVGAHTAFDDDFTRIENGLRTRCGANYVIPRK